MNLATRPSSWPLIPATNGNLVPILDRAVVRETAAGTSLPDETWLPLLAAVLAFDDMEKKQRGELKANLDRHTPALAAFDGLRKMTFAKGCAAAAATEIDLAMFCVAMLTVETHWATLKEAVKHLAEEEVFGALGDCRLVEYRLTKKALPRGLARLAALDTFTLLSPGKLRSDANVEDLAALPEPVYLNLEFDGKPDAKPERLFRVPGLDLLTKGGFRGLAFKTTGIAAKLSMEDLAPLAGWSRLRHLSLRNTTLARPDAKQLEAICGSAPELRTVVLSAAPKGDLRARFPECDIRLGPEERPAT